MTASAVYEGVSSSIALARDFAGDFLDRVRTVHGVPERAAWVVLLVVSELVTNVCKYAPGLCRLDLAADEETVTVSVRDSSPVLPVPMDLDAERVGQHGLEIVAAVCREFDVVTEPTGKRTRAVVSLVDETAPA
ncbi:MULTISPECIES: ATP-binding protein [Streptomyces]|uniref:ATP-binding protein n=1 Tax=Streptomyces lichenis TaxID=2306967 RepID=A0ABT0I597_9ACTN|nr:ATP-binding protein [Streptomyces lichenis]MCK8676484.1 ATP-binding protein [Streptomyces lichenis]